MTKYYCSGAVVMSIAGREKKAELVRAGNAHAFVDASEWQPYNLWCIENLENMIRRENEQ